MRFLSLFNRNKKFGLPERYKGIVNEDEYNLVIDIATKYHVENKINVIRIGDGEIIAEHEGLEQHRYLDNLLRLLAGNEKAVWKEAIYEHFDKIKDHDSAYSYLFDDFKNACQFLRVLIKGDDFDFGGSIDDFVHRYDFPLTKTFLVFEFEQQFRYIAKQDIIKWKKPVEDLFETAILNTPAEEIEVRENLICDEFTVFAFLSGDYSASLMIDLKRRADFSIGLYGSLIAIPTKGSAFVHPIEKEDIGELINALQPMVEAFYNEDPGNITQNLYWQYDNKIHLLPLSVEESDSLKVIPVNLLKTLMGK
jgi:hypothetical protein